MRSGPHTLAPFLGPDQRESKGWGLERIGCLSENLMLFKPRSKKVRVRVWIESGKREVDAQSPWLQLAATVFRSTNSRGGSNKVPLSLSLIFPSFNFLNKKEDFLFIVLY